MKQMTAALLCAQIFLSTSALAGDRFFEIPVRDLELTEGSLPGPGDPVLRWNYFGRTAWSRVILDGPGVGFLAGPGFSKDSFDWFYDDDASVFLRVPGRGDVGGRLVLAVERGAAPWAVRFRVPAAAASGEARDRFLLAREAWFGHLARGRAPGSAWFRHRARELRRERLGAAASERPEDPERAPDRGGELQETFSLFTGGRAVAENMQVERVLRPSDADAETVPVEDIEGITVKEMDWAPLLEGKDPATDPLASMVPSSQYAIFVKKIRGMNRLVDEARAAGAPVLSWLEARSRDALTWERYQRQLCVSLEGVHRVLAPMALGAAAITGSDPFLRTGSDVAVIVETSGRLPFVYLLLRHALAAERHPDARRSTALRGGRVVYGLRTPDRRISSYLMPVPGGLVVTNSMVQIDRISAVLDGAPALAGTPEHRFFRDRYPRSDRDETALVVVPDAALRAWAGPRSRILTSRRIRVAAALSMLTAQHLEDLVAGTMPAGPLDADVAVPDAGRFLVEAGPGGQRIRSQVYGTLDFLTPLAELPLETVTRAEADAYAAFRRGYQYNWRQYFDPLAVRFSVGPRVLDVDLSVFPLIRNSEYRELIDLTAGAAMAPAAGDPHEGALLRYGMSIDRSSGVFRQVGGYATSALPGVKGGGLSWLGDSLVFYLDDSPLWDEAAAAVAPDKVFEENLQRIPAALQVEVSGALEVAAFLSSFRAFVEQTAPNILKWETRTHNEKTWVRVGAAHPEAETFPGDLAIHYAVDGRRLLITLDEELMKRALARDGEGSGAPWLGRQVGLQAKGRVLDLLDRFERGAARRHVERAAWASLPILAEWRRLFPDRDPAALHEAVWVVRLRDPAGGGYAWDPEWKTMTSARYGHPAAPKPGPGLRRGPLARVLAANLGLTFELGGLRARARITRSID